MVDATDATFETDILERSDRVPVVVDLWAEWCGPCRTLGPILEKVVGETDGEVELVKVDTDTNPGLSQAFQVQGIPAVHAVYQRKVVASFIGAQPEAKVREFVDALRPTEAERAFAALLAAGDIASLEQALAEQPGHVGATVALAEAYVEAGRYDDALAELAKVPETPEARHVAALARTRAEAAEAGAAEAAGDEGPLADVEARFAELLPKVKDDEEARQACVDLLELLGPADPRTAELRKQLTRQLF